MPSFHLLLLGLLALTTFLLTPAEVTVAQRYRQNHEIDTFENVFDITAVLCRRWFFNLYCLLL
jgi:hypothetical protein